MEIDDSLKLIKVSDVKNILINTEIRSLYISERFVVESRNDLNKKIIQIRACLKLLLTDYYWNYKYSLKELSESTGIPANTLHMYADPFNLKFKCPKCGKERKNSVKSRSELKIKQSCRECS